MKKTILLIFALIQISVSWANGITVNNVSLENFNESEGWVNIQFDIFWANSWRVDAGPSNWDAAWVFAKYRTNNGPWRHVTLSEGNTEVLTTDFTIDVSNDNKGAFIYRSTTSNGTSSLNDVRLGWNLNANGIDINDTIEVKVFAIEMVYVPEGPFYIGGGGSEVDQFKKGTPWAQYDDQFLINSEDQIEIGTEIGQLYYEATSVASGDQQGPIPAAFPKGYNAFYCMKYEISEQQYVEFFNTVDPNVQSLIDITDSSGKNSDEEVDGNTVSWLGIGTEATTSAPDRACGFLSGGDLQRYLQWAGLRPMTEFEFEKAARGPGIPVPEAYAWGNSSITTTPYTINQLTPTSTLYIHTSTPVGPEGYGAYNSSSINFPRPVRCGLFAYNYVQTAISTRQSSGSSYYGIMELSGNLAEMVVSIGNSNGRLFTNNYLSTTVSGYLVPRVYTSNLRGGGWNSDASLLRISDRTYGGASVSTTNLINQIGGRGVRTAD